MLIAVSPVRSLVVDLFVAQGAPPAHAEIVADHLMESSRMGLHSHGLIRVPQYYDAVASGEIDPKAVPSREQLGIAICRIDGHWGFGQVAAHVAADIACELAGATGVSIVLARHLAHIGRVGAYVAAIADRGLVALAFCSGPRFGHWVAPFGGREGRMATNPMAYAFPTSQGPVVADFATSAATEGNLRYLRNQKKPAPDGFLRDASGAPTNDPSVIYAEPRGTIQPLGGETQGHKGSALGILVDVMASVLAGDDVTDASRRGNNLALIAVAPQDRFEHLADNMADYIRSTPPLDSARPVMMPGDRENANLSAASSVLVDDVTWSQLAERAERHGIAMPHPIGPAS